VSRPRDSSTKYRRGILVRFFLAASPVGLCFVVAGVALPSGPHLGICGLGEMIIAAATASFAVEGVAAGLASARGKPRSFRLLISELVGRALFSAVLGAAAIVFAALAVTHLL
jgi:hypothetical protein